jgi:hypothetical protein
VVVGAFAVAFHGRPRYTGDIDVLVRPEPSNAARIAGAIHDFGFAASGLNAEDFTKPDQVIQLGVAPNRIDLLTSLTGVSFAEVWENRTRGDIDGVPVWFIGRDALARNKQATGRPQDLADLEWLKPDVTS